MPDFPILKTGAIAQHPATREVRLSSESLRFLDSSEQRYRDSARVRRRWVIELNLLTPTETARLREFFVAMKGSSGRFDFEDPWTGLVVNDCRFGEDSLVLFAESESDARTVVTVWEP